MIGRPSSRYGPFRPEQKVPCSRSKHHGSPQRPICREQLNRTYRFPFPYTFGNHQIVRMMGLGLSVALCSASKSNGPSGLGRSPGCRMSPGGKSVNVIGKGLTSFGPVIGRGGQRAIWNPSAEATAIHSRAVRPAVAANGQVSSSHRSKGPVPTVQVIGSDR
ncbi:hypothetical protein BO94DRAFT_213822 [Aspergillus sclerotioniger CBS 115572]|uniref:Uncharacterized protein n=1 Tax=Aspergillus sclerotioniger CBS 115572 TaxID=1450535 RepID=A0A317XB73_9EURO|nr:hypothetical protein BO94DRAFT_213822 [Aspergillus sclerotioniger CBS 115572]PWY94922.1 hypothetical protein BO94DRAFT_213822 [Aspergillus sclerotioniger CBS 115572]